MRLLTREAARKGAPLPCVVQHVLAARHRGRKRRLIGVVDDEHAIEVIQFVLEGARALAGEARRDRRAIGALIIDIDPFVTQQVDAIDFGQCQAHLAPRHHPQLVAPLHDPRIDEDRRRRGAAERDHARVDVHLVGRQPNGAEPVHRADERVAERGGRRTILSDGLCDGAQCRVGVERHLAQ